MLTKSKINNVTKNKPVIKKSNTNNAVTNPMIELVNHTELKYKVSFDYNKINSVLNYTDENYKSMEKVK